MFKIFLIKRTKDSLGGILTLRVSGRTTRKEWGIGMLARGSDINLKHWAQPANLAPTNLESCLCLYRWPTFQSFLTHAVSNLLVATTDLSRCYDRELKANVIETEIFYNFRQETRFSIDKNKWKMLVSVNNNKKCHKVIKYYFLQYCTESSHFAHRRMCFALGFELFASTKIYLSWFIIIIQVCAPY